MLAARAQTMTSVIDAVTEQSIIGTDLDGIIRVWNPGAEKMLGLPRPDVVRKRSILEFHLPEELDGRRRRRHGHRPGRAGARRAGARQRRPRLDLRGRRRRSSAPSRSPITPRTDDQGAHAGWNFVGTDMTEARATERMKDQFVSLISHELRTPLTSILGYLELVLDDEEQPLTDEQRSYLTTVERNADRLLRLVGDLLFTAQVDAGRFTLQARGRRPGRAWSAPRRSRCGSPPPPPGSTSSSTCPPTALVVPGDAVRLGQACDNLVSNAVKFTPAGGRVTLSLRSAWQTPDGEVVATSRARTRPRSPSWRSATPASASPPTEQGKLFTRFFRASTAQKNAVPGVGLGLAITKAITTAHGGTLDLRQRRGRGHHLHADAAAPDRLACAWGQIRVSPGSARAMRDPPRRSAPRNPCGFLADRWRVACGWASRVLLVAGNAGRRHRTQGERRHERQEHRLQPHRSQGRRLARRHRCGRCRRRHGHLRYLHRQHHPGRHDDPVGHALDRRHAAGLHRPGHHEQLRARRLA